MYVVFYIVYYIRVLEHCSTFTMCHIHIKSGLKKIHSSQVNVMGKESYAVAFFAIPEARTINLPTDVIVIRLD